MKTNIQAMKIQNILDIYETNGVENKGLSSDIPKLIVCNHWNIRDFVVVEISNVKYTVLAIELKQAIENSQNCKP